MEGEMMQQPYPVEDPRSGIERKQDSLADLFEVPSIDDADMYTDDLVALPEPPNVDDLVTVTDEDIMGRPPQERMLPSGQHWSDQDIRNIQQGMLPQRKVIKIHQRQQYPPVAPGNQITGLR